MRIQVKDLRIGDYVDLEGDPFVEPNVMFESEYMTVASIYHETPTCIAVGFEGFDVVGFPPDHEVEVQTTTRTAVEQTHNVVCLELAASLACYVSEDDWGMDRQDFLVNVRDRIDMDLLSGEY